MRSSIRLWVVSPRLSALARGRGSWPSAASSVWFAAVPIPLAPLDYPRAWLREGAGRPGATAARTGRPGWAERAAPAHRLVPLLERRVRQESGPWQAVLDSDIARGQTVVPAYYDASFPGSVR